MKFVKVCDWIHWCDILKKTFNKKNLNHQNVPNVIGNIKLYMNNLNLFYKFYWMIENIKKNIYKKRMIQYILYKNKFNI